jgi:DMSO reductase anchor subunit
MSTSGMHGETFRLGYRFQRHWDTPMANAFFCGELGAGTFFVSLLAGFAPGMVLGLLITGIGKPVFHLTHMGVPGKAWRAILRPDRSWTSRGLVAIVVFTGAGIAGAAEALFPGLLPAGLALTTTAVAGGAALVVATYQGFAMSHSTAIGLWSTAMMPFSSLLYALAGGTTVVLLLHPGSDAEITARLVAAAIGLLGAIAAMLAMLLHAAYHGASSRRLPR